MEKDENIEIVSWEELKEREIDKFISEQDRDVSFLGRMDDGRIEPLEDEIKSFPMIIKETDSLFEHISQEYLKGLEGEIEIIVSIRNVNLKKRRLEMGLTQKELSEKVGIPATYISQYESFKKYPKYSFAQKLADFFETDIKTLFPDWVKDIVENKKIINISYAKLMAQYLEVERQRMLKEQSPYVLEQDLSTQVEKLLDSLSPREEKILRMRYGIGENDYTLEEIGEQFQLSRERIRQIEKKALRKLKHPSKSGLLRSYFEY